MKQLGLGLGKPSPPKRDPNCTRCNLHAGAEFVCLWGSGSKHAEVMIIGEAPGRHEDDSGTPFVGKSGMLLDDVLQGAKIRRDEVYITNAVHCRPPDNRTPSKREIEACKHWLLAEIQSVQPKFILTLGNIPLQALTGLKGIKSHRGKPIEVEGEKLGVYHPLVYVFPTYHPSFALRDARNEPVLRRDVEQFARIVRRGGPRVESGLNYRIVTSETFREAIEDISSNNVVAWDTETSGLDPFAPGFWVSSIGVATRKYQWCFPLNHSRGPLHERFNTQKRWVQRIADAMKGRVRVAHNGKFDTLVIAATFGIWMDVDFDTMLAHYNLNENAYHGLDHLSNEYFGAIDYDIPLEEKHGFGPLKRHCEYLALDVYYTRKLYFELKRQLNEDPSTKRIFEELTMPVARMYADIEFNGVYVNPQKLEAAHKYWTEIAESRIEELNRLVPDERQWKNKKTKDVQRGINWGSPDQVAEVLFNRLKLSPIDQTPGGKNSVSESVLLRLAKQHPVPKLILEWREASKNLGTFIEGWQKRCHNNVMHPSFKVHGTTTGRPSCVDPNLQQTPRDKRLRSIIDAPLGWVLVDADESQAELRIAAEMSGDRELRLSYQTGVDVHTLTVQRIFGIMNPTKEERKKGKAINFGFLYGMGWRKFKEYARDNYDVEFTDAECKLIRKRFFQLYSGLVDWHKRQRTFARRHGYVRSIIGRKRRLPDATLNPSDFRLEARIAEAERQAINSPVQSLASDINLLAAVQLWETIPREYFRISGTVHDSILFWVRSDKVDEVLPQIKEAMEWPRKFKEWGIKMSVPLVSEAEIGPWGDGKVWQQAA